MVNQTIASQNYQFAPKNGFDIAWKIVREYRKIERGRAKQFKYWAGGSNLVLYYIQYVNYILFNFSINNWKVVRKKEKKKKKLNYCIRRETDKWSYKWIESIMNMQKWFC